MPVDEANAASALRRLLAARVVWVTGKGGTGKTTTAAALARVAAASGKRTLLVEVDNQLPSLTAIVGFEPGFEPRQAAPNLSVSNLLWPDSLVAYLQRMLPLRRLVKAVLSNQVVRQFIDFTPGARELVTLSVLADQRDTYDLVVVDMPASGHAFALLDITRTAGGLFRAGPVRGRVDELVGVLRDPSTVGLLVALPETMVVNETLETADRLMAASLLAEAPEIALNRARTGRLSADDRALLAKVGETLPDSPLVEAGLWANDRADAVHDAIDRLDEVIPRALRLGPHHGSGDPRQVVAEVAAELGALIGLSSEAVAWT